MNLMFINRVVFLITVSQDPQFGSVHAIENRQVDTIRNSLLFILKRYDQRGFQVNTIMVNEEFRPLAQMMPEYEFNLCGANDHVPDIEWYIRTTKSTVWCTYNDLPFECIPQTMLIRLVENAAFWQNAFPHEDSVTPNLSPRYIIEG
jgi:hypothetical protein